MRHVGLEATQISQVPVGKLWKLQTPGSNSRDWAISDLDLERVITAWPALPADVRKMIVGGVTLTLKAARNNGAR